MWKVLHIPNNEAGFRGVAMLGDVNDQQDEQTPEILKLY